MPLSSRILVERRGFCREFGNGGMGIANLGSPSFILARRIKALKDDLKKWNKKEFRDLAFRKKCLLS